MNEHHPNAAPTAFAFPDALSGSLSATAVAGLLASVGDVAFVLDAAGAIVDVAVSNRDLLPCGFSAWVGRAWADTVTIDSAGKVAEMLAEAARGAPARWRQVNHATDDGEVPLRYMVVTIGDRRVAIGRDLRGAAAIQQRLLQAQQSLERDYLRMREAETRYRLLFDMATEPVLIVDAGARRIREANPAAHRLLGAKDGALVDQLVSGIVDATDREAFVAYLGAAGAADDLPPVTVRLAHGPSESGGKSGGDSADDSGGDTGIGARIGARLFRQGRTALLLVRIAPSGAAGPAGTAAADARLAEMIEHMPDAFVLADSRLTILTANASFVELTGSPSADRVTGAALGTWLGRPGIDLELILGQLREHGTVRNVATIVRGGGLQGGLHGGPHGGTAQEEVELSGVAASGADGVCYGFTIRRVGRRLRALPSADQDLPRSVEQLTELVGRMSLKDIVRESTDLIERLCIEAALVYTSDNRASAAEVLGVSRQSLYSKLHRHGLGNLAASSE